jgi:hypothetical protein
MISNKIKTALILGIAIVCLSSCTKKYKCMRYQGAFDVYYNPKEQSCYYNFKGQKQNLTKETCASLCYEDL